MSEPTQLELCEKRIAAYEALLKYVAWIAKDDTNCNLLDTYGLARKQAKYKALAKTIAGVVEFITKKDPPELLQTYFVYYNNEDGSDYTAFIRATSPQAAFEFWQAYAVDSGFELDSCERVWVRTVPDNVGPFGVIPWDQIPIFECGCETEEG